MIFRGMALSLLLLAGCAQQPETHYREPAAGVRLPATLSPVEIDAEKLTTGQTVYVPIYSNTYRAYAASAVELVANMSVRNVDAENALILTSVVYYGTDGSVVRKYLERPHLLGPMATADFVIERSDTAGGAGANFVVEWGSETAMTPPLIEAVMFGASGNAGISFLTRGVVTEERRPD